jgi:glycosyltransferase involved in cell wall biosynthesis
MMTNLDLIKEFDNGKRLIHGSAHPTLKNQDLIEYNELSINSNGGTELTTRRIFDGLDRDLLSNFQIITSRVRELDPLRKKILHLHDLPGDPESDHLRDPVLRQRFDKLVFVSNWQYQQYRDYLGVPFDLQSTVIENGIDPADWIDKPKDKIRLIYSSTPHRGLNILIPVFVELAKTDPDIELDVYSSFGVYGWSERDQTYAELIDMCKTHPQINYFDARPHEEVLAAYQRAHILAYPSIWLETSCRVLMEAMSAGCMCIHPNYGALPETSGGLTMMYGGDNNLQEHAGIFAAHLKYAIDNIRNNDLSGLLKYIKSYADARYSWKNIITKWNSLLISMMEER